MNNRISASINKPLIPVKFCYFLLCSNSFVLSFITVLYKQRGIFASEHATIYVFAPIIQILPLLFLGMIIEKTGKPTNILSITLTIKTLLIIGILLLPSIPERTCSPTKNICVCLEITDNIDSICTKLNDNRLSNNTHLYLKTHNKFFEYNILNFTENSELVLASNFQSICMPDNDEYFCAFHYQNNSNNTHFTYSTLHEKCFHDCTVFQKQLGRNISIDLIDSYNHKNFSPIPNVDECFIKTACRANSSYVHAENNSSNGLGGICNSFDDFQSCRKENQSRKYILVIYGLFAIFYIASNSLSYRIFEVITLTMCKEHHGQYGKQHFYGTLGELTISPIAGYVADLTSVDGTSNNYTTPLCLAIALHVLLLFSIQRIRVPIVKSLSKNIGSDALQLIKNPDVVVFAMILLVLGTCCEFSYTYTPWFLVTFHAPGILLGLYEALKSLYGLPFQFTASWIIRKLGVYTIFVLAHFSYCANFVGMSLIGNPWLSLVLSAFLVMAYDIFWVASMEYSHGLGPKDVSSSVVVMAGGLHFTISKSLMGLSGGYVLSLYGERVAFRFMAVVCLASGLLVAVYYTLRWRRIHRKISLETAHIKSDKINLYTQ